MRGNETAQLDHLPVATGSLVNCSFVGSGGGKTKARPAPVASGTGVISSSMRADSLWIVEAVGMGSEALC